MTSTHQLPPVPQTPQEVFDRALSGIRTQGYKPSYGTLPDASPGAMGACLYRGPEGAKCAFGHILPDEVYDLRIENSTPDQIARASLCNDPEDDEPGYDPDAPPPNELPAVLWVKQLVDTLQPSMPTVLWGGGTPYTPAADFLADLQKAHDCGLAPRSPYTGLDNEPASPAKFEKMMAKVAERYGLTYTAPAPTTPEDTRA
jgi:hypothetical protein